MVYIHYIFGGSDDSFRYSVSVQTWPSKDRATVGEIIALQLIIPLALAVDG